MEIAFFNLWKPRNFLYVTIKLKSKMKDTILIDHLVSMIRPSPPWKRGIGDQRQWGPSAVVFTVYYKVVQHYWSMSNYSVVFVQALLFTVYYKVVQHYWSMSNYTLAWYSCKHCCLLRPLASPHDVWRHLLLQCWLMLHVRSRHT